MRQEPENATNAVKDAEQTLRLVSQLPAPDGLTDRVHARLERQRLALTQEPARRGFWHLWLPAHRIQFAGAAVLAGVVSVSMISVRHSGGKAPQAPSSTAPPAAVQSGAFGTSAAQAHPASLKPILVPGAQAAASSKKKKPSASHSAKRPAKAPAGTQASTPPVTP